MKPKWYQHGVSVVPKWSKTGTKKQRCGICCTCCICCNCCIFTATNSRQQPTNNTPRTTSARLFLPRFLYKPRFPFFLAIQVYKVVFFGIVFALVFRVVFERVFGSILSPQVLPKSTLFVQKVYFRANVCDVFPDIAKKSSKEGF